MSADRNPASADPLPPTPEARRKKVAAMSPAELILGPGALPSAPLDMPEQVIEVPRHRFAAAPETAGRGL